MKKGLTGNIHHGGGLLTSWKKKGENKIIKSRIPLFGYPKNIKFNNEKDINEYLNNEKLICLLCGRSYKFLGLHIVIHGHNVISYKELFNIISDRGLIGLEIRKKMQKITIERNKGDLREAIKNYNESRELPKFCKCGNPYNIHRKCSICSLEYKRKHCGHLPRKIAAKTIVIINCTNCGKETPKTRLGQSRPNNYCSSCKEKKYYESQEKYHKKNIEKKRECIKRCYIKNKEKYREKARLYYLKRKGLNNHEEN